MEFKEKLYRYRVSRKFTQTQMGAIIGLSKEMICLLETGKREPSRKTLTRFEILTEEE